MKRIIFPVVLALCAIACGGAPDLADEIDADATASTQLFTVRRDERKCAAPACGGYFASPVKENATAVYVPDLDLSRAGLDAQDEQALRAAPAEELLFKARLSAPDKRGLRTLLVKDAWRGMPGIVPAAKDVIFSVAPRSPVRTCVAAPCNNQVGTQVASGKTSELSRVSVQGAAHAFVDQQWLQNRVATRKALAAAHVASGAKLTAGTEVVLEASQVWLHLPESAGPCAAQKEAACGAGQVQAYQRTADRCVEPVGCVTQGICPMMTAACPEGYARTQWVSAPNGCAVAACDPAWLSR
jgi:uncharacterized protein DUF6748